MDKNLLKYCKSGAQERAIRAIIEKGSMGKAAKHLGMAKSTICEHSNQVKLQAAIKGYAPDEKMTRPVADPFVVKGTSMMFRGDSDEPSMTWVKTAVDRKQMLELAEKMGKAFFEGRTPLKLVKPPERVNNDLLSCYVIADLHIGMYSWARETGQDYDCDIASQCLLGAMDRLMAKTPPSGECLIAQLGDLLHLDDDSNQTRRSGNALDVDTRYARVAEVGFRLYRRAIDRALQRHQKVHVVNVPGNHDDVSAMWLGIALKGAYESNPRVTIDTSPGAYFYHQFGKNLIGMCHGHTCKMNALGEIMVSDRPKLIGETEYRYWLTGHIHHEKSVDLRNCKVESFRTLAARDAWHSNSGYRSMRDMKAIVFHREYGEDERYTVSVREILGDD